MKKTKAILMALCAVLLVAASVMGTLAYLTSTDEVVNTFTVGKVKITLDEAKVGEDGKALADGTRWHPTTNDPEQEYHLLPGHSYDKDPTVTVKAGSDKSYVRMLVTVSFENELTDAQLATSLDSIFTGYDATKWDREDKTVSTDKKSISYEYRYSTTVKPSADTDLKLAPLFTKVEVPNTYTNEDIAALNGMQITVVAQAIQAYGFANADAAWTAFEAA